MESGIYIIRNTLNDKCYIGQSSNLKARWAKHKNFLKNNKHHNKHLQAAWNKYGEENFVFEILEKCPIEELDRKEIDYIRKYKTHTEGYNLDEGGQGIRGYKHTEEELTKMREIQNPLEVIQCDLEGTPIQFWRSASQAGKTLGLSIRGIKAVCERRNRQKTIGGFIWVYKQEYDNNQIDWDYYLVRNIILPKTVLQFDLSMNFIKEWNSLSQIERELGISIGEISSVCHFKRKTSHGFIWRFKENV